MRQGVLPFKHREDYSYAGVTSFRGLPIYLDLSEVCGLAFIPKRKERLRKLSGCNRLLIKFVGSKGVGEVLTLDMDATLIETMKARHLQTLT